MERVHKNHPEISYGDLWTLAGVCAIQELVTVLQCLSSMTR
jgi:cytochrome c peroxidase